MYLNGCIFGARVKTKAKPSPVHAPKTDDDCTGGGDRFPFGSFTDAAPLSL